MCFHKGPHYIFFFIKSETCYILFFHTFTSIKVIDHSQYFVFILGIVNIDLYNASAHFQCTALL